MGTSKASSVAPRSVVDNPGSIELSQVQTVVQTRDFHFAVTWVTLFAHLDLIESTGPRPRIENPSPSMDLVPVVASAPLMEQRTTPDSNAAWEMVVPKMIRTGPRTFVPADGKQRESL
jgi:hypothetical protein